VKLLGSSVTLKLNDSLSCVPVTVILPVGRNHLESILHRDTVSGAIKQPTFMYTIFKPKLRP